MSEYSPKDFFNAFKISGLLKEDGTPGGQPGNLQEYTFEELKEGVDAKGNPINATQVFYSDGSDAYANRGFVVSFLHVPSNNYVHFKAFINSFNETFNSDWSSESVFGRTDPIRMFKQTTRSLTLSLIVPASSEGEGFENLGKVQSLLSFLYPTYEEVDNALTISQSPLIRMRLMNLVRKTRQVSESDSGTMNRYDLWEHYSTPEVGTFRDHKIAKNTLSRGAASEGLLGVIRNVSINHNLENLELGSFVLADGVVIPRAVEVTLDFDVLHEKVLGWNDSELSAGQSFSDRLFPYGVDVENSGPAGSQEQLEQNMALAAKSAVQGQVEKLKTEEADRNKEQMIQNAIAAGHLVASGVIDGKVQYETTAKGERRAKKIARQMGKNKTSRVNPANPVNYPDSADGNTEIAAGEAYRRTLAEFIE